MEKPSDQLPTTMFALYREIFPRPTIRFMAYGRHAVMSVVEIFRSTDDAFIHSGDPEKMRALQNQREAEQDRKFAAWAAERCDPKYRQILLDEATRIDEET